MITLFSMSKHVFFSYQVNCPLDPKKVYKCISSQAIGRIQIKISSRKIVNSIERLTAYIIKSVLI